MCWVAHAATGVECVAACVGVFSVHVTVLLDLMRRMHVLGCSCCYRV
jgi:hypothetical protein